MHDRRTFLSGLGSTLALGSLAGCLDSVPGIGGSGGASRSALTNYLPAAASGEDGSRRINVLYTDTSRLEAVVDSFADDVGNQLASVYDPGEIQLPFPASSVDATVQSSTVSVIALSGDDPGSKLADGDYTETETHRGATLYQGYDQTVAVDGTTLVVGADSAVRSALDANAGEADRLTAASQPYADLAGVVSGGALELFSGTEEPGRRGTTLTAFSWSFGEQNAELTLAIAFQDADSTDESTLSDMTSNTRGMADYEWSDPSTDGVVVSQTGSQPIEDFDLLQQGTPGEGGSGQQTQAAPQVNFSFDYAADGSTVEIVHEGGDHAQAANLTVTLDGEATATQWSQNYETVTAGDSLTVDVSGAPSDAMLQITWAANDRSYVIAKFQLP
ncbi:type IV pilin [Haloarchaeobius sp. DT45]|uniref:type IV pilin n=1 Tax=Haloarchaeobius sp. DT45 TaxID=3446116 RepID=UPI003F6C3731